MFRRTALVLSIVLLSSMIPVFSQEKEAERVPAPILPDGGTVQRYIPKYDAGQAGISLGLGAIFPLFFQKFTSEYISDTRLTAGGTIWFEFDMFLWKGLSAGAEFGGMFAFTPNNRTLFMAPITGHIKYTFQIHPIEFPVSFSLGVNMGSLAENFKVDFVIKPKVGITYRINQNWSAGVFVSYWWIVQSYEFTIGTNVSRFGNFIDTSAGFSYVF